MAVMTIGDLLLVLAVWTRFFGEPGNRVLGLLFLGFNGLVAVGLGAALVLFAQQGRRSRVCVVHLIAGAVALLLLLLFPVLL